MDRIFFIVDLLVPLCPDTRQHFNDLFDVENFKIIPGGFEKKGFAERHQAGILFVEWIQVRFNRRSGK